ncbi:MAG: flagellar hook-associated protein FlgK [Rhodospirillales bacterium]|nr:flagellar hook-associated protein FlgK [Rhodospirillales bacterium]
MAGSLSTALRTTVSGLNVNERALNTIANNISNVHTEGYTRKTVQQEQRVLDGVGVGVHVSGVTRAVDESLIRSLRLERSQLGAVDVQENYFARTQEMFGAPDDDDAISHTIAEFSSALESLAMQPQNSLEQREVVRWANQIASQLNGMSETLQDLRLQADREIELTVGEINSLLSQVADLNEEIVRHEPLARDVSDLKDQRDLALDQLSELIDIRTFSRANGDIVVYSTSGDILVDNVPATLSHDAAVNLGAAMTYAEGDLSGVYVGVAVSNNDITGTVGNGELQGLIELRDKVLPNLQSELDTLAAGLRDTINAVHNRGMPFPGLQEMTGSRQFIEPATQTVTFSGTDDTTLVLLDAQGNQVRTSTMRTLLGGAGGTIDDVATAIDTFLGADGSAAVVNGNLVVEVSNPSYYLSFRDESATAAGSSMQDAAIQFDADGDGNTDETVSGFSNFFGLNDFFVNGLPDNIYESEVLSGAFKSTAATLSFRDPSGLLGTVAIAAGSSLGDIATAVNDAGIGVTAGLVSDGAGTRLRISSEDSGSIVVTDGAADTLLADIGLDRADVRVAATVGVREDILNAPALVSRGIPQWDPNRGVAGEYHASIGDDTLVQQLAETMTETRNFRTAGNINAMNTTFSQYAANVLADNATLASINTDDTEYERSLVEAMEHKLDSERGVNLDEELAHLVVYEQAYAAAARVMGTIKTMFETLDRILS